MSEKQRERERGITGLDDRFHLVLFVELEFGLGRLLCRFPWRKTLALPDTEEYKNERSKLREKGSKRKRKSEKKTKVYPRISRVWRRTVYLAVLKDE